MLIPSQADVNETRYGFEMALVMAGNAINQDHAFAEVYTTCGANNVSRGTFRFLATAYNFL